MRWSWRAGTVVRLLVPVRLPRIAPGEAPRSRDRLATDAARRRVPRHRRRRRPDGDQLAAEAGAQLSRHASLGRPVRRALPDAAGASDAHRAGAPNTPGATPRVLAGRDRSA